MKLILWAVTIAARTHPADWYFEEKKKAHADTVIKLWNGQR
jgi:hypothetical protein